MGIRETLRSLYIVDKPPIICIEVSYLWCIVYGVVACKWGLMNGQNVCKDIQLVGTRQSTHLSCLLSPGGLSNSICAYFMHRTRYLERC